MFEGITISFEKIKLKQVVWIFDFKLENKFNWIIKWNLNKQKTKIFIIFITQKILWGNYFTQCK